MALSRPVVTATLVGFSLLGAYAAVGAMTTNGFGDAINIYIVDPPHRGFPGAPQPLLREYTGVAAIDDVLAMPVGFFSALFDGDVAPEYRLYTLWGMVQFAACWTLVVLEGLRVGNRGRLISWTGTYGIIYQLVSWTLATPLWLVLHLFTSPIASLTAASPESASSELLVDLWDLAVLPLVVVLTFFGMGVPMAFPWLFSAHTHYLFTAFWQPFPLWHSILQPVARRVARLFGGPADSSKEPKAYLVQVKAVYGFVVLLSVAAQVSVLQLALAPASVRESLVQTVPALASFAKSSVSFSSIFVPLGTPWNPPTVADPASIVSGELAPLAIFLLHYDMYFGCGALVLWALYLHRNAVSRVSTLQTAAKTVWWFALGGFAAAAATLLWERDSIVEEDKVKASKKTK